MKVSKEADKKAEFLRMILEEMTGKKIEFIDCSKPKKIKNKKRSVRRKVS